MSYPSEIYDAVEAELDKARDKFPDPDFLTTAMAEEAGEAVRAILNHMYAAGAQPEGFKHEKEREAVRKELIQTTAMCVRLLQEGGPIHKLPPLWP